MSARLREYLADAYLNQKEFLTDSVSKDSAIQIDDMDDNDDLTQFCAMFITVGKRGKFVFELLGPVPLTQKLADLVDIYNGSVDRKLGRLVIPLNVDQIEVLMDLASHIRTTPRGGTPAENHFWHRISARTISSIYRFVRIIKEYSKTKGQVL